MKSAMLQAADDVSIVYRLAHMKNPGREYIPRLRSAYRRLKDHSVRNSQMISNYYFYKAFLNVEDFGSLKFPEFSDNFVHIEREETRDKLRRLVEYFIRDDNEFLNFLMKNIQHDDSYRICTLVYAMD